MTKEINIKITHGEALAILAFLINIANIVLALYIEKVGKDAIDTDGNIINALSGITILNSIIIRLEREKK